MKKHIYFFIIFLIFSCTQPIDIKEIKGIILKTPKLENIEMLLNHVTDAFDPDHQNKYKDWKHYLGDPGRSHYSQLSGFTTKNVKSLKIAWTYEGRDYGQMQMNPIIIDTLLYGVSPSLRVFALDARSGKEIWVFGDTLKTWYSTSRGVSYWELGDDKRIFYTRGPDLWALNAITGLPVSSFGDNGKIDLRSGLPTSAQNKFVVSSTPGTIFKNLIIMPLRLAEGVGAAPGDVMAFDVVTGNLAWSFHTLPHHGEPGVETWGNINISKSPIVGAANNWAGMALDEKRQILYVPTGSAAPDFYGAARPGKNLFSNCLLALNANTGELIWHYQFVHHDLWDRDLPAPPNLVTVNHSDKSIPAVAQITKQGYVFLFHRETGKPLFNIEEVPVPLSELPGEQTWPTQPVPTKPSSFARQSEELTVNDISPYCNNCDSLVTLFENADRRNFAPPSLNPALILPGYDGGAEWGGAAADPEKGILYINSNEMAWFLQMRTNENNNSKLSTGERIYRLNCAVCHMTNRVGSITSGYPSLLGIKNRLSDKNINDIILQGKGMMPGFPQISEKDRKKLIALLTDEKNIKGENEVVSKSEDKFFMPYQHTGYTKFLDSNGLPAISPPWGTLQALDLNTGEYIWKVPLGETESLKKLGYPTTGTENYGGAVVTENGLLFIAATKDGYIRAFNKYSGKLLWEFRLPAAAFATPALYSVGGKQYLTVACGGEKLGTKKGNKIITFSLSD